MRYILLISLNFLGSFIETREWAPASNSGGASFMSENNNVVLIGKKMALNYVLVAVSLFQKNEEIILKGRGKNISKTVDVAEIISKKFLNNVVKIKDIKTSSEELEDPDGRKRYVSSIEIILSKTWS